MIAVDIESSGVDYIKHSIVSIGAINFDDTDNRFYEECRIWDGARIEADSMKVNGFTKEQVIDKNKKSEGEMVKDFIDWALKIEDYTFAGQNPSFDKNFLESATHRAHLNWPFAHRTIDTYTLAYMHIVKMGIKPPIRKHHSALNLDTILNYVGIPSEPKPHNALNGALSHAEVISRLLYDKKLLREFDSLLFLG